MNNQIKTTSDYSKFKPSDSNRDVIPSHIKNLERSMKEHGFLKAFPLSVKREGQSLILTDGQNRLAAAKNVGVPVFYIESQIHIDPASVPAAKAWKKSDFIRRYAHDGIAAYLEIIEFINTYGVTSPTAVKLLCDDISNNKKTLVQSGEAEVITRKEAHMAASSSAEAVRMNKRLLINPLAKALFLFRHINDQVPFGEICKKVETHAEVMEKKNAADEIFMEIESAYNFRKLAANKKAIALMLKQKLSERKANFGR